MPIYSIKNKLYIGKLPEELKDLTIVEEACIARARILLNMIKFDSKGASGLRGNVITFLQNPDRILQYLPQFTSNELQILFTGKKKPSKDDLKKILRVRRSHIQKSLNWLKLNNILYQDVIINDKKIDELSEDDIPENIFNEISYDDENCEDSEEKNLYVNGYDQIDRKIIDIIETNDLQSSGCNRYWMQQVLVKLTKLK
jgi:hypothetical protein